MWADELLDAVLQRGYSSEWPARMKRAYDRLFGAETGRYPADAREALTLRAPEVPESKESTFVPFAALIHPSNPASGAYGGMSIAIFPSADAPCLLSFVVGTNGLAPDEIILGRPGHARKVKAICAWLNAKYGKGKLVAWAKNDPVRIDEPVPDNIVGEFSEYGRVFKKYGNVLYAIFGSDDRDAMLDALTAFFDLMFEERGVRPLTAHNESREQVRRQWFEHLMPGVCEKEILDLLRDRRYVVLAGPPGTGKTRMAIDLVKVHYRGRGFSVQFHANTTYENFVGGLAPEQSPDSLGLRFAPRKGFLMRAAEEARQTSDPYLLHIDEINRADLSKVLGEAIFLLEPDSLSDRRLDLAYDFGEPFRDHLQLPENLHVIGTMNTADRSLAIVDVAIRRRFAFKKVWPQMQIVRDLSCELMQRAFADLISVFVEHASDESFDLVPGHSYFLEKDDSSARRRLKVTLAPLLEEYLAQGYVAPFAEPVRSYLQWVRSL
jgi:5-methylcytosine-specific restriction enzyme B